jgi:plastocyanin
MKSTFFTVAVALAAAGLLLGLGFAPGGIAAQNYQNTSNSTGSNQTMSSTDNNATSMQMNETSQDNNTATTTISNTTENGNMTMEEQPPIPSALNKKTIVVQGTASSPGGEGNPFQVIDLLPPRPDGKVYSGEITFTATKPLLVAPLQNYGVTNETLIKDVGDLFVFPGGPNGTLIAPAPFMPQYTNPNNLPSDVPLPKIYSATVQFTGSGLSVGRLDGQQFLISYTIHATLDKPTIMNSFDSAISNQTLEAGNKVTIPQGAAFSNETAYDPNPVTIRAGDNVTWINNDADAHTVTSGSFGDNNAGDEFDSGYLGPHRAFSHVFDKAGEFDYFCEIHPNMVGKVVVKG